jgi:hypothetical protein
MISASRRLEYIAYATCLDDLKVPRVGLNQTPDPWLSNPWRFLMITSL